MHWEVVREGILFDYTGGDLHEREELGRGHESPLDCWKVFWKLQKRTPFISARAPVLLGIRVDVAEHEAEHYGKWMQDDASGLHFPPNV